MNFMVRSKPPDTQTFAAVRPGGGTPGASRGSLHTETVEIRGRVGVKCGTEAGNGAEMGGSGERHDENYPEPGPAAF